MRRNSLFKRLLEDLLAGDPVALGFVIFFAVVALFIGLVWLKVRRDLRCDDEQRQRRRRGRKPE